ALSDERERAPWAPHGCALQYLETLAASPHQPPQASQLDGVRGARARRAASDSAALRRQAQIQNLRHSRSGVVTRTARRELARCDRAVPAGVHRDHVDLPRRDRTPALEAAALPHVSLGDAV